MTVLLWASVAAAPLLVLLVVLFNIAVWPRGRPSGSFRGRVSVLIPARNESAHIAQCIRSVFAGSVIPDETIVYDDGSTDDTAKILDRIAAAEPRLRTVRGLELPDGWVGKPHALHHLAAAAAGDLLVFIDADTMLEPTGLARLANVIDSYRADLASVAVRQTTGTFFERLMIPLLHLEYLAWLPLPLVWRSRDPRLVVANGQLLAIRRNAYDAAGGWAAVGSEVVDDVAFARRVKATGGRVVFADGFRMAASRMYTGARELHDGFAKNLYEGVGGRPLALVMVVVLHAWIFLLPYVALAATVAGAAGLLAPAIVGVGANVLLRALMAARFRQPPEGIVLHPLAVIGFAWIAFASYRSSRSGQIRWRGRSYAARGERLRASDAAGSPTGVAR